LRVFTVTKTFPREERYALIDQVRRSSRAVKAMIAEAWARRRYKAAFVNKIDRADDFCKHAPTTDYRTIVREDEESPFTDY
jgi:four helix bundle protein